ncbi:DUF2889 domain-containing protein [Phenylobacterium sp.]|uniref:DUF2889 domain-containing protein n=1 Tax=Phenylobacterium sp. TaxID=1871053 RepID=UPI00301CC798
MTGSALMRGAARDLYTGDDPASPEVIAEDRLEVLMSPRRVIERIEGARRSAELATLVGAGPPGPMRKAVLQAMPDEVADATLLHRLLDDTASAAFVSTHGWAAWTSDWRERHRAAGLADRIDRDVTGVCMAFRPGSAAVRPDGRSNVERQSHAIAPLPLRADDPYAWHRFEDADGPNQRRSRRIDLWAEDGLLRLDAEFQDSAALPGVRELRNIFHEYRVQATVEPDSLILRSIAVTPAVLPYGECIGAALSAQRMVGSSIEGFGRGVAAALPGTLGCTHLNSLLAALRDVVALSRHLEHRAALNA